MSASKLPAPVVDFLAPLAEAKESGLLEVMRGPYRGQLFLQRGVLVQAEFLGKSGLSAAYDLLALDEAVLHWHPGVTPVTIGLQVNVVELVEELRATAEAGPEPEFMPVPPEPLPAQATLVEPVYSDDQEMESGVLRQYYVVLEWTNASNPVEPFQLRPSSQASYLIGRSQDCNLTIPDSSVEPLHASLLVHSDFVELWDLGTDRKTAVNGEIVEQAVLTSGDLVTLGNAELRFSLRLRRSATGKEGVVPSITDVPRPQASLGRLRGPITAESLMSQRQADGGKALGKVLGKFFEKKKT